MSAVAARVSASWRALGTTASLLVSDPAALVGARRALEEELAAIDLACSRFRADSELSRLNAEPGRTVRISALLAEALDVALRVAHATAGAVDPTVGRAMRAIGYDRDFADGLVGPDAPVACPAPGPAALQLDVRRGTALLTPGAELDLGATAKALAADRAARAAHAVTGAGVLVNLGGDVAVAGAPPPDGWSVGIGEDHASRKRARHVVRVDGGGLATSSTTVRCWDDFHHVVDPATGVSASVVWRTASVAAGSCVDANAASTAAIVLGASAPGWLRERGLPARLVAADGAVVAVAGWPEEEEAAAA